MCRITMFPKAHWPVVQGPPYNQIPCDVAERRERRGAGLSVEEYREREAEQRHLADERHEAWLRGEGR